MALTTDFIVFKGSELIRLRKDMSTDEVRTLLGNNFIGELCQDSNDQKWVYDFPESKGLYKLFFRHDKLEWAMNGIFSKKDQAGKSSTILQKNKNKKKT